MSTAALEVDVTIVGGGMVGASLAVALQGSGVRAMLIESVPFDAAGAQQSFDARTTALGNASQRIFAALGIWERVAGAAQPIHSIHVSEAGRFGFARLEAREQGIEAFGYVIANRVLGAALWQRLAGGDPLLRVPARVARIEAGAEAVTLTVEDGAGGTETVRTRLVVAADGAQSMVRSAAGIEATVEDYDQVAVVTTVATDQPHGARAYERFTRSGPLAVLPLHDGTLAVIWARAPAQAQALLALDEAAYLAELQAAFGWRAGRFVRAGVRGSYPLRLTRAATAVAQRTVLIGNAAQALHPVAGQGFNLGLRDAAMLAELIVADPAAAGDPRQLQRFADWRAGDRAGVTRFTDSLVKLFGDPRPGVGLLRSLGLLAFDLSPPAKSALARVSAGFAGPIPRLARGLPVRHV